MRQAHCASPVLSNIHLLSTLCHLTHDTFKRLKSRFWSPADLLYSHDTMHLHQGLNIALNNLSHLHSKSICTQHLHNWRHTFFTSNLKHRHFQAGLGPFGNISSIRPGCFASNSFKTQIWAKSNGESNSLPKCAKKIQNILEITQQMLEYAHLLLTFLLTLYS